MPWVYWKESIILSYLNRKVNGNFKCKKSIDLVLRVKNISLLTRFHFANLA